MRKTLLKALTAATVLGGTALAAPLAAHAETYQINVGWAPTHIITKNAYTDFAESVNKASGGSVTFEVFTGGSLLSTKDTLGGVANGVAVAGMVTGAYLPADLPLDNTGADMAFVADNPIAAAFAWTELNFVNSKLQDEWKKNGVVFGGGYSTPVYNFICTTEVKTADDIKGKKVRTAGAAHVRFAEFIEAVPVSVSFAEVYTGLQRGSLDCAMADPTALVSGFKIAEVAKYVTMLPMGTHFSGASWVYNPDFWKSISADDRRMLFDQMALAQAHMQIDYNAQVDENLKGGQEQGVTLVEPDASLVAKLDEFKASYVSTLPKVSMENRKVEDPTDIVQGYVELETKWKKLLEGVDNTDAEALAGLLKQEVFDKLDAAIYGVN